MSPQVISFSCLLKNRAGKVLSFTYNRDVVNDMGKDGQGLKGLVAGLQNLTVGEHRTVRLSAEEAFGFYDPTKVIRLPRKRIFGDIKVGGTAFVRDNNGNIKIFKILQIEKAHVCLDGNHPLAGEDLIFEVEALSVRLAKPEDLEEDSGNTIRFN